MKADFAIILALSILFLFIGFILAGYFGMASSFSTGFGGIADFILLCAIAFVFSTLLNGYSAPFFMLYFGTVSFNLIFENPIPAFLLLAGAFVASYAGVVFSVNLQRDFYGKDNLFMHLKEFVLPLIFAFLICTAAAIAIPYTPDLNGLLGGIAGAWG